MSSPASPRSCERALVARPDSVSGYITTDISPDSARGPRGRYDWTDPASKVWVDLVAKGDGRTTVTVTDERLPDADTAAAMKERWRGALDRLKAALEV